MALVPALASAKAPSVDDPDVEMARRHFGIGTAFYRRNEYSRALREFQIAREAKPLPELDYNIARCLDRLERYPDALDAYQRYADARRDGADAAQVRERIAVLKARLPKPKPIPAPPAARSPLEGTNWRVTSNAHDAATFRFLGKGKLLQSLPKIKTARRCSWRQDGPRVVTECGTEGVTWLVSSDRMFGQSSSNAWSAQRL